MRHILPVYDIDFVVSNANKARAEAISASRVRELIANQEFSKLEEYVFATTLEYLMSAEADPIRKQLQHDIRR